MTKESTSFILALQQTDYHALTMIPKSDLHNHALLGSRRSKLEAHLGKTLPAPGPMQSISDMDQYIITNLVPYLIDQKGFIYGITAALNQAVSDGITLLEMSVDSGFISLFPGGAHGLAGMLKDIHNNVAPQLQLIPQLGLNRGADPKMLYHSTSEALEAGYFKSVDLYGDELARPAEEFKAVFQMAAQAGLSLKAHAGEFGDAESVRNTVEVLELHAVQHGIAAATSPEVMNWLHNQKIQLNVCPSSNVLLGRVPSLKTHPARLLFDHGVNLTLNTDDLMIFDQSVCDEYLNLYKAGLFSAEELDIIRLQGLAPLNFI